MFSDDCFNDATRKLHEAFVVRCRKCGSDAVTIDITQAEDFGGDTGVQPGSVSMGCLCCKTDFFFLETLGL